VRVCSRPTIVYILSTPTATHHCSHCMRVQVLLAASMKMTAFSNMALCSLVGVYRSFRGSHCLHCQGVNFWLQRDYTTPIPEDWNLSGMTVLLRICAVFVTSNNVYLHCDLRALVRYVKRPFLLRILCHTNSTEIMLTAYLLWLFYNYMYRYFKWSLLLKPSKEDECVFIDLKIWYY
jgi:hypothetical protein